MFDNILGNEIIIKSLKNSIKNNKINNSYTFSGENGLGKKTIANEFIKLLMCENINNSFCDNCYSCISINENNNKDLIYIDLVEDKKTIGIDYIKDNLIKKSITKPIYNKYKIFLINNAGTLTHNSQNSILKIIEEPNKNNIFIFLVDDYKNLLSTILSRCTLYKVEKLNYNLLKTKFNFSDKILEIANGNLGIAKSLQNNELDYIKNEEEIILFLNNLNNCKTSEIINYVNIIIDKKYDLNIILKILKDEIVYKNINNFDKIETVLYYQKLIDGNCNFKMCIHLMLLKIRR